jgi:putative ABC transport system permease protein
MRAPFWVKLAWREARSSTRRLGVYMGAITFGVAALVAINSFRMQVVESVDGEAKTLLGADIRLQSNRAFPDSVEAILDSAVAAGVPLARVTSTITVALTEQGVPRLVQVRAVESGYPFYGAMVTQPDSLWPPNAAVPGVLLERSLLALLDAEVGDSVRLGAAWFRIDGVLTALPPELSPEAALGPRVYIHVAHLDTTGLLRFGSLARYQAFLQIRNNDELQRFVDRNHDVFRRTATSFDTADEQAEDLGRALEALSRFLGLVGLSALLLGGLGVASAVNVFVSEKRRTVAILRCLGATQRTAFGAYMLQATALGTLGAILGAALGIAIQGLLPSVLGDLLPIDVPFTIAWPVVGAALGIGTFVAAAFALLPLLAVRGISPLRALRHDVDDGARPRIDVWRVLAFLLIIAGVAAIAVWQARVWQLGLLYAGAIIVGMLILWLCAKLLMVATRRIARAGVAIARAKHTGTGRRRAFPVRQGIANLYRPRNQTTAVTMALGFGVFLLATLWVVQRNLLGWMRTDASRPQPTLVFFDIQRDQVDSVRALLQGSADGVVHMVPLVSARLQAVNGKSVDQLLDQRPRRVEPWALRREYRHTYRDTMSSTERLVRGKWFDDAGTTSAGIARVSIEEDVARSLDADLGDTITWDVSGRTVQSVITSVRSVEWARFETNFFFVFEPGVLDAAPQTIVSLAAVADETERANAQRSVVERYPNVTVIDLASVQRMLQRIVDRVIFAVRFMAAFSVAAGALVLVGAIGASRFQRVRESAMLRALGATRRQIRSILIVEYAMLGALAALTGVSLAAIAGWLLMRFVFEFDYDVPWTELALIAVVVTVLAAVLGMLNSREALRSTPLAALREAES